MKAIRINQNGGPEVLSYEEVDAPTPGSGEVLVDVGAAGVNFIDVYQRSGAYKLSLPFTLGLEAAGTVAALGPDVREFKVGDHVAWSSVQGSYAEQVVAPVAKIVPVPASVELKLAAAAILQGITAHYLVYSTYPVQPGDRVLIQAAAGGVGLLLVQMAKQLGAFVIGTTSTEEKAALVREAGADEVILYTQQDFEQETKRITEGRGVDVVYDSVGKTTFDKSLNCLRPRGYMVLFGQSSGAVAPVDPQILNAKGSLYLTRPTIFHYTAERAELLERASDLFGMIDNGSLKVRAEFSYPLAEAAEAHRALEGRATTGKVLLIP
jgi:NADPH:quinone reductase